MVMYTEQEVAYRDDLTQKLLTLEHAKSVLIGRGDDPMFVNQLADLQTIVKQWMAQAVREKQQKQEIKDGGQPPTAEPQGQEEDPDAPDE